MNFILFDIKTANPDMASISQIGLVQFSGSDIVKRWKTYVDPEDIFRIFHIGIPGSDTKMFTGRLNGKDTVNTDLRSITKIQVATHTVKVGCHVEDDVTCRTFILIIGDKTPLKKVRRGLT